MLSSDCPEPGPDEIGRARGSARSARDAREGAPWEPAFNAGDPWDARSAEALTRLYESEEGDLRRPAVRERDASHARRQPRNGGDKRGRAKEPADKPWLEAHLSRLAKRLQDSLSQSDPKRSLAALNERLDVFEQRFSAALGRVAQRADLDGLKSIEANVIELAAQLDRARDRLEQLGAVDDEVRGLARRLDETGEQRAGTLEKLLCDCMAEWRESEQRTASALHSLEEAVGRLGDTVDAMEASKPAQDLAVPPLVAPELQRAPAATDTLSRLHAANGQMQTAHFYHAMLDAADYAPRPTVDKPRVDTHPGPAVHGHPSVLPATAVEWSAPPAQADFGRSEASPSTPGGWHVMAMRAKLRSPTAFEQAGSDLAPPEAEAPAADALKRSGLGLLLMAGAAVLAGTTYFLYRAVAAPLSPVRPAVSEPVAQPGGGGSEPADPAGPDPRRVGAS